MKDKTYFYGVGKRKTAIARVKLLPGNGSIIINGIPYEELFPRLEHRRTILHPLLVTDNLGKYNAVVKVVGGGVSGQGGAISLIVAVVEPFFFLSASLSSAGGLRMAKLFLFIHPIDSVVYYLSG